MMHLKYPRRRGFFHWDELGCLARALGFHENLVRNNLPEPVLQENEAGLSIPVLHEVFDLHKYLHTALDRTSNIHTDEWNIGALKKAIQLLDKHVFTFEEIDLIRMAYQVYEAVDTKGMFIEEKVLQRAIKMCGRMISPQKMIQRVKHMVVNFEEKDRMQLHEFMDLLLWCELYEGIVVKAKDMNITKDERDQFELEDFKHILSHYDERLAKSLDQQYTQEELQFVKEKFGSKRMPRDVPPVDPETRIRQVKYHQNKYKHLYGEIGDSTRRVQSSRAGYIRGRPISAPEFSTYKHMESSRAVSAMDQQRRSVMDMFGYLIRPATAPSADYKDSYRPHIPVYNRPQTPVTVTTQDLGNTYNNIDTLHYEMETIDMKYKHMLNEDLDYLFPGYRQRMANRPKPDPPRIPRPKTEPRPSPETISRLALTPRHRVTPPAHAKACDARYRGWYKVKTRKGHHNVLSSTYFEKSPTGKLLSRLQNSANGELKREPVIHRYTRGHQAVRDAPRPHTSPAVMVNSSAETHNRKYSEFSDMDQFARTFHHHAAPDRLVIDHPPEGRDVEQNKDEDVVEWKDLKIYQQDEEEEEEEIDNVKKDDILPDDSELGLDLQKITKSSRLEDIKEVEEEASLSSVDLPLLNAPLNQVQESPKVEENEKSCNRSSVVSKSQTGYGSTKQRPSVTDPDENPTLVQSRRQSEAQEQSVNCDSQNDLLMAWFKQNPKFGQYQWVKDIMYADYSDRLKDQQRKWNYRRLSHRVKNIISKELQQQLAKGLPVAPSLAS